jgi:hypothetical protein
LRIVELAESLATEFTVQLFAPKSAPPPREVAGVEYIDKSSSWNPVVAEADAVISIGQVRDIGRVECAASAGAIIVTENVPPIEQLDYPSLRDYRNFEQVYRQLRHAYRRQLEISDHFLSRSSSERVILVGNLSLIGRLQRSDMMRSRTLDHLISLVPVGYSRRSETEAWSVRASSGADFVWSGGLWSFYRPELLVRAVAICHRCGFEVSAAFLYAARNSDNSDVVEMLSDLVAELKLEKYVLFWERPPSPDERSALLMRARGMVCVANPGIENEANIRMRVRDSRLYGIPTLIDAFGATAKELEADGLASLVQPLTAESLAASMIDVLGSHGVARRPLRQYCYETSLEKFIDWLGCAVSHRRRS